MTNKILLVEDEENLAKAILLNLDLEGFDTQWIKNGNTANTTLLQQPNFFDLVILDVMLPEKDGYSICKNVREAGINTPILFLSARNTGEDKVLGLKAGADDYLGKPFNLEEFLLRVKILLERHPRSGENRSEHLEIGLNRIDTKKMSLNTFSGDVVTMTKQEIEVLTFLIQNPDQPVSREELIERFWNDSSIKGRSVDNMISRFRKWMEKDSRDPQHFISVRGMGYKFKP